MRKLKSRRLLGCGASALVLAMLGLFATVRPPAGDRVKAIYQQKLGTLETQLQAFKKDALPERATSWAAHFTDCRAAYKQIEYAVEYYYPAIAFKVNGPALAETEPGEPAELVLPTGFQVLEEEVFNDAPADRIRYIIKEVDHLIYLTQLLQKQSATLKMTEPDLYDALRLNMYRLASKGITGFDSPVALHAIEESDVTIIATSDVLEALNALSPELKSALTVSHQQLSNTGIDFNHFDRARFLLKGFNPLMAALHQVQVSKKVPFIDAVRAVRADAVSFFSPGAFDVMFFAPPSAKNNAASISLGEQLFKESRLSGSGRSCASCHAPARFYTDGLKVNKSLQRDEGLLRNTPTLLNAALQPTLFWDSRVKYLEEQAHEVITNKAEMDGSMARIMAMLKEQSHYKAAFGKAFPKDKAPISEANICSALAAYVRSLISLNAPFDRYMRGEAGAMNQQQINGFNLFMGKAKCATCHYMPLFNGVAPPNYLRADGEVLGTPANTDTLHPVADSDRGMYLLQGIRHQDGAFKTPTVRNVAHTAPYMHNGVYKTLEEVIDFYDRGGGAGMGLSVPTQTLPSDRLHLTKSEKGALVAFLEAL